jgi:hypothetical protein
MGNEAGGFGGKGCAGPDREEREREEMSDCFIGPFPEWPGHNLLASKPFVVSVDTEVRTDVPWTDYKIFEFDTYSEAAAFSNKKMDPDKQPAVAKIYTFARGEWLKVTFVAKSN